MTPGAGASKEVYTGVQTPEVMAKRHPDEKRSKAPDWTVKYWYLGTLAQILVFGSIFIYVFGLLVYSAPIHTKHMKVRMTNWWGMKNTSTTTTVGKKKVTVWSMKAAHSEMARPTFFSLWLVLPLLVGCVAMEFLRHYNVRRITSHYILQVARVLRRKPRIFNHLCYFSYGELVFLIFILGGNALTFGYLYDARYKNAKAKGIITTDKRLSMVGTVMGYNCIYNMAYLFLPATRNAAWMEFLNISYVNAIKYHRWLGVTTVVTAAIHTICYYTTWIRTKTWTANVYPCKNCTLDGTGRKPMMYFYGQMAMICMVLMSLTSIPYVRRRFYDLFYYVHQLLFATVFFVVLHYVGNIWWILPSFGFYLISRIASHASYAAPVEILEFSNLDHDIVKIVVSRSTASSGDFKVGQFVYLNVPSISKLQWHAFTISSSPLSSATTLTLLAKSLGDWTNQLVHYAEECKEKNVHPVMYMDGYYGASLEEYDEYSTVCLLGGGIGVTPLLAILEDMVAQLSVSKALKQKVMLIFTFRELALLEDIHPMLVKLKELDPEEEFFSFQFFLTRVPSDELLDRNINYERLSSRTIKAKSTMADRSCAVSPPTPFSVPIRSSWIKSLAYILTLILTVLFIAELEFGGGKINKKHPKRWPTQYFVEVLLLFAAAVPVYFMVFGEKFWTKFRSGKNKDNYDINPSYRMWMPKAPLSVDVHTLRDLVAHYNVTVGHRPDVGATMARVLEAHRAFIATHSDPSQNKTIGVFMSGPASLKDIMSHSVADLGAHHFDMHEEEFEL